MSTRRVATIVLALALATTLIACGSREFRLRYEPNGSALTGKTAESLAATADISALSSVTATDAPALRESVLKELRTKGTLGIRAADLLTTGFPTLTTAVPVLVRVCLVDGTKAIVVVEAFGDTGGTLTHRRLWVFDRASGTVLRAASFR
jgi:hypothetical protein